jgi:nitrate reductase cytochrome c-type subunit
MTAMKKPTYLVLLLALSGVLLWGCTREVPKPAPTPTPPAAAELEQGAPATPQREQAPATVESQPATPEAKGPGEEVYTHQSLATGSPGMVQYNDAQPGQSSPLERAYPGAPPQIPHSITGLAITKDSNPCLGCHQSGMEVSPGHTATKIPDSHYLNPQTGEKGSTVSGRRYVCVSCHVPQSLDEPILQRTD